jgi:predicted aspartyl protease
MTRDALLPHARITMLASLFFVLFEHAIIVNQVYINGAGPFRMAVDTGAQSTSVTPDTAAEIGLRPEFRVEHVTAAGSRLVPGGHTTVQTAGTEERRVETIICELPAMKTLGRIDGVLGQSWLQRFAYTIDYRHSLILLNAEAPEGERIPLSWTDGRPAIPVRTDHSARWMVLDSGAPIPVLFGKRATLREMWGASMGLTSNNGSTVATRTEVRLHVAGMKPKHLTAAVVTGETSNNGGLLPLRIFSSIYVNTRERYAIVRDR